MPRLRSTEIKLKCSYCNELTQTKQPIIIKKETGNKYHIKAYCAICNKQKNKYLNMAQIELLTNEIKNAPDNTSYNNFIIMNGGSLPLLNTLGAILSGKPNIDNIIEAAGDPEIINAINTINNKIKSGGAIDWGSIASFIIPLISKIIEALPSAISAIKGIFTGNDKKGKGFTNEELKEM